MFNDTTTHLWYQVCPRINPQQQIHLWSNTCTKWYLSVMVCLPQGKKSLKMQMHQEMNEKDVKASIQLILSTSLWHLHNNCLSDFVDSQQAKWSSSGIVVRPQMAGGGKTQKMKVIWFGMTREVQRTKIQEKEAKTERGVDEFPYLAPSVI